MRLRRHRPDASELAYERMRPDLEPVVPLPPSLHRVSRRRLLVYAAMFVMVLGVLRGGLGRGAPPVDGSCDRPGFAFDRVAVDQDRPVKWSVAGPDGTDVVITANSTSPGQNVVLGPLPLEDCGASGRFGVRLGDGDHVMRVFLLRPDGGSTLVGQQTLTVNAPR